MKNTLIIIPGGGDPFYNEVYFKTYQLLIDKNLDIQKFDEIKVLSMPGHFSFDNSSYWDINLCVSYLRSFFEKNNFDNISLLGRSGGCNIITQYLNDNVSQIRININEVFLINPARYEKILDLFIDNFESNKIKSFEKGLRISEETYSFIPFEFLFGKYIKNNFNFITKLIIANKDEISFGFGINKKRIEFINDNKIDIFFIESDKHEIDESNQEQYFNIIFKK